MRTFNLMLNSINDVKDFVNIVSKYDFDVDLTSGRYVVDAKSIMGIFSLNLSKPIKVEVHSDDCDAFIDELKRFIVDWLKKAVKRTGIKFLVFFVDEYLKFV